MNMLNGDEAMSPAEFAKLMGAYPQPAENPLPAYGGYMDNSPANFAWVNNNDYFGAEEGDWIYHDSASPSQKDAHIASMEMWATVLEDDPNDEEAKEQFAYWHEVVYKNRATPYNPDYDAEGEKKNCGCGQDPCITYGAEAWSETDQYTIEYLMGYNMNVSLTDRVREMVNDEDIDLDTLAWFINNMTIPFGDREEALEIITEAKSAETFEAPYGGAGSLMDIGKETPLADFTGQELAESSAIHGDFDQASLNYSGHQNLEVRAEDEMTRMQVSIGCPSGSTKDFTKIFDVNARGSDLEYLTSELEDEVKSRVASWNETYEAEMEELTENMVEVTNRFDDSVGRIHVEDVEGDIDDIESVDVSLEDMDGDMIASFTMSDEYIPEELDDYLQDQYATETKKGMWVGLASLAIGTLAWLNRDSLTSSVKRVFNNETQEMLENDPELIENPEIGNLDPAQYEELVVQSTGYAVDVIPVGLDGSFMGSRFAALPTERYVEYNDPGIGAHTDIAMNRDEIYLEPEMAMVQASENVIKEAQAPGQSPYNSITGEENPDFDYRVIKETHPVSLDPAVKPFIPQSMAGYTGNANTPPSVMNKMFNIGVLGQTPAFVPGSSDMGANHFGSRNATPNTLGLGGVVGGPLSDQVNASYTDGTTSMSLAQWSIENTVSQTSDTEAVVIDRSSGLMKRVRRV